MPNKSRQISSNSKSTKQEPHSSSLHTPYILNGELYEIQTRDGENVTVKCCNCPPDRVYRGSVRSTGNFHMHIKRRHSALLGKLHEMKVTALLERRDRLRNIRRVSGMQCGSSKNVANEERELKIKTVFKRHKQEKQEQGVQQSKQKIDKPNTDASGAVDKGNILTNAADEMQDAQLESVNMDMENAQVGTYTPHVFDDPAAPYVTSQVETLPQSLHSVDTQQYPVSTGFVNDIASQLHNYNVSGGGGGEGATSLANPTSVFNQFGQIMNAAHSNNTTMATNATNPIFNQFSHLIGNSNVGGVMQQPHFLSSLLPFGLIKPELLAAAAPPPQQQQQLTEAIDLTMHTQHNINSNFNHSSYQDVACQIPPTVTITEPSDPINMVASNNVKDIWKRIESSLRDIQVQLNIRNQIESKRVILDMAKFKFQNPEFGFQF